MFGKPEWFSRRKYLGWGIMPKTWQGWLYLAIILLPFFLIQYLPQLDQSGRNILLIGWSVLMIFDFIDIMARMRTDERERIHEAIAERNALWAILVVLVIGTAYQIAQNLATNGKPYPDPVVLIAIFVGLFAKAITNLYLDRKD